MNIRLVLAGYYNSYICMEIASDDILLSRLCVFLICR